MLFFSDNAAETYVTGMPGDEPEQRQNLRGDCDTGGCCQGRRPVQSLLSDLVLFGSLHKPILSIHDKIAFML